MRTLKRALSLVRLMRRTTRLASLLAILMLASTLTGSIAHSNDTEVNHVPPTWPEGSDAYDDMVSLTQFGYRRIDTSANEEARNWIADQLTDVGYEIERQPFTTEECSNCENIVVTIPGLISDSWMVVGAHHDAICYSPPPLVGATYPGCTSAGAYDDGTGSGALLELARTFAEWNITPTHTWKLGWWDYEEWQGSGSSEGGGKGSLHFVENIPEDVNVTYVNLDMFGLNWPVPTQAASQASGCDEDYWTLYMFTSPIDDWSYYENEGLEVNELMQMNAEWLQSRLKEVNANLTLPEEWVRVIDDTKGNSDHYNFIMAGHAATWLRGQHQYILEEGDSCEQTPKHAQSDSVTTLNTLAGGRSNVESGLQSGLDVVAMLAWWDRNESLSGGGSETSAVASGFVDSLVDLLRIAFMLGMAAAAVGVTVLAVQRRRSLEDEVPRETGDDYGDSMDTENQTMTELDAELESVVDEF